MDIGLVGLGKMGGNMRTRLRDAGHTVVGFARNPEVSDVESLEALVELHVAFAVDERALLGVWGRELPALSDDLRRSLRRRMRAYEQPWQEVLACLRGDLDQAEVAVVIGATLAMLNATALATAGVSRERLAALLRTMALAALLAPPR